MDNGEITEEMETKQRARILADTYGWDVETARAIWCFGLVPDGVCNILVEQTRGVQYLQEIKDSVCTAFQQCTLDGVYCGEPLRGIQVTLTDVVTHADAIHRGMGQISPATKKGIYACQINAEPGLMEPMYMCDITVPSNAASGVYTTLNARRGMIEGKEERPGTPLEKIRAYLPVLESFGFTNQLRQATSGQAFPQLIFSHWNLCHGRCDEPDSPAGKIVTMVRERKGLPAGLPNFNDYYDKL